MGESSPRKIIHIDMDAFFASVEQRDHPHLRGKPVLVGGSPQGRGVVAAASYEARKYGVRSAMPAAEAKRRCPNAIFVRHRFEEYRKASFQIRDIFQRYTDLIEPLSLDEAYLDVTENKVNEPSAQRLAMRIKADIFRETQLTASAGVGPNKMVAKIASDWKKPNGIFVVRPEEVLSFLGKLPVEKLHGVGPSTAKKLHELGLHRVHQIRTASVSELERKLGKFGRYLHHLSLGNDNRSVKNSREMKSCGTEQTFSHDIIELSELRDVLAEQSDQIAKRLNRYKHLGKTITLKARYADFETVTRSKTLPLPTNETNEIQKTAEELLKKTEAGLRALRLIGISVSSLTDSELNRTATQLEFDFSERR